MAYNVYPTWLQSLLYPANGVGCCDDLKHTLETSSYSSWISHIHPGWYYLQGAENYFYVQKVTNTFAVTGGVHNEELEINSGWGPIVVKGANHYSQVANRLYPAQTVSWNNEGNDIWSTVIPAGHKIESVRDLTNIPFAQIGSLDLLNQNYYYSDGTSVYVKASSNPATGNFLDTFGPLQVKIRELAIVENSSIRLQYSGVDSVNLYRGTSSESATGTDTFPVTIADDYEWVVAEYYVNDSFCVLEDEIELYCTQSETVTVTSEGSNPILLPGLKLFNETTVLDFNPLNPNHYGPGYLVLSASGSGTTEAASIEILTDKTTFCSEWEEEVIALIKVLDKNGNPIPKYPVTLTTTATVKNDTVTNKLLNNGSLYLRLAHTATFNLQVTAGTLSKTVTFTNQTAVNKVSSARLRNGLTHLVITKNKNPLNGTVAYASNTMLDGIPMADNITLYAQSSIFQYNGTEYKKQLQLSLALSAQNLTGMAPVFGVKLITGDRVFGTNVGGQSKLLKVI